MKALQASQGNVGIWQRTILFFACLYLFFLLCNLLTPMMADDFAYSHSFLSGERITSVSEIFPSLGAHMQSMNGRTLAHFFAQLFLLLPWWLFDLVNAGVFCLQIFLMYRLTVEKRTARPRLGMYLFIFTLLFLTEPDFGQVNLWLDGACNYLWSIPPILAYLYPFVRLFLYGERVTHPVKAVGYLLLSVAAGGYLENVSGAAILVSMLLLCLVKWKYRQKTGIVLPLCILFALMGLATVALSPAQFQNKGGGSAEDMLLTFLVSLGVVGLSALPVIVYVLLRRRAKQQGIELRVLVLSYVFLIGAAASNFVMVLAAYYPLRCAVGSTVFLILACGALASRMDWKTEHNKLSCRRVISLGLAALLLAMGLGFCDIMRTHALIKQNENVICSAEEGKPVTVPGILPLTKYSALFNLKYLSPDPADWPNDAMAKYYGVTGIGVDHGKSQISNGE